MNECKSRGFIWYILVVYVLLKHFKDKYFAHILDHARTKAYEESGVSIPKTQVIRLRFPIIIGLRLQNAHNVMSGGT